MSTSDNMAGMSSQQSEELLESQQPITEQIDFQHHLRTLRKHKWLILAFSAVITSLAGYYAYTAVPVYQSTSTLLIESQGNNLVQFEELVGLDTENQDYYQTQFELLRSRGLAVRVLDHLNLWDHAEFSDATLSAEESDKSGILGLGSSDGFSQEIQNTFKDMTGFITSGEVEIEESEGPRSVVIGEPTELPNIAPEPSDPVVEEVNQSIQSTTLVSTAGGAMSLDKRKVVDNFMRKLTITPVRKTKLVKISFESTDPDFAALVANTVGDQYIESYLDAKLELTTKASRWLNERLADLKSILEESEDKLITFKQANGLVDVGGSVGRLNEQELLLTTAELAQARSELSSQADLFQEVQNLSGQPSLLEAIPAIQADPLVQRVKIEQGQAQRSLDELRNRYGERHPRVVDANSQLATINTTLQGHLTRVAASISKDYQLARQRVASIESKLASGKQEIQSLGTKTFELDELEREVQTNREIYNAFFSRITEAKSADGLETANARISDAAVPSIGPIKPKKRLILALAALVSLIVSMLMAILYEQMDDTVKSTGDIEEKLGLKLLGILPLVKTGFFGKSRSLPLNPLEIPDKKGRFAEAVNTTRTAVCMDDRAEHRKVIAVTSSVPGEGKSSTSINLAYSLGQLERVLLIDCDLRKPTIAKAAGLDKNTPGLSSLITKSHSARDCIKQGAFGGSVDIIPSGPIPDQPLEFLSSIRFEKIVSQLSEHYDRIIIDCAPTQAVSDALVISRLTDAMIYCVKSHDTSIDLVRRGIQRLNQVRAPLAGVIITQVDIDKITTYGGDYYYQGYYDYYGYTDNSADGNKKGYGKLRLTQEELHQIRTEDDVMELDLDYMSPAQAKNANHQNASALDSYDEFDSTEQFGFNRATNPIETVVRGNDVRRRAAVPKSSRLRGDLDIL